MINTTTYTVGEHFLSAIFNGDTSGLSDEDAAAIDEWTSQDKFNLQYGHFAFGEREESEFGRCEVTSLMGDVVQLEWVQMLEPPR